MNNSIEEKMLVDRLLELGGHLAEAAALPGGEPFVILPSGCKVESLAHLCPPSRIKQRVKLIESGSFVDYVNRFKSAATLIFADLTDTGARFVAVMDYHGAPDRAAHGSHTAEFVTVQTKEWQDWMSNNAKPLNQVAFAEFLEEHVRLIIDPPGAELLELVQDLQGHSNARFASGVRLQSGALKLSYDEDVQLRGGNPTTKEGALELPREITAGIAPFQGSAPYEIKARLKFGIEKPHLKLWYETVAPHKIVRDSILLVVREVAAATGIVPLIGSAG